MIQREVTDRAKVIAEYLQTNDQRFFGSLIVAAYDGQPRFLTITFGEPCLSNEGRVGVLQFDGTEQYYALDGQHRLAAFQIELEREPARYKDDEISMILICHPKDKEGLTRARRLFTTVNRYAKKTSPATHTAMSEDDGVAIVNRTKAGGHILVRPVGITAFVGAMSTAPRNLTNKHIKMVVDKFQDLNDAPWKGVLWNPATKKMTVTVEAEKLARRLWKHLLGLGEDKTKLTQDWRAMVEPGSVATHLKLPDPPKKTA
jgi:DNA-sulfur modification-associated